MSVFGFVRNTVVMLTLFLPFLHTCPNPMLIAILASCSGNVLLAMGTV